MYVDSAFYLNRRDNPNSSVKSSGKADLAIAEYDWIHDWLSGHPDLAAIFMGAFGVRRWHNIHFTMRRLSPELRKDF